MPSCNYKAEVSKHALKKYIQDQDRHDIMRDKLTSREYQDPFKG